ncbi:SRPBCC domain-containing protein [Agromyces sp. Marseille-P2726]|uniref:SRPBCC family protein n=1 Tax=Agromyces sp. Marseille-P2726 TaxID=2709132 RepID=UPI001570C4AA|nr:SRPBCC domain-containing protein [Agromyces sp. Marseille-P2726]
MTMAVVPEDEPVFSIRRRFDADAARLFRAFVEPARLAHWFVVEGYRTPADRMKVTARPGGRVDAVMIADADGSEIPFGFRYAELEAPRRVVLAFDEEQEVVTVTLNERDDGGTDLSYTLAAPATEEPDLARRGAEDMLDRIAAAVDRGAI